MLRSGRASVGNDGVSRGSTTLSGCSTPIECAAIGRKSPQQDRSHKPWHEANGGAQCGKSARCVRRGGGWKRGMVGMSRLDRASVCHILQPIENAPLFPKSAPKRSHVKEGVDLRDESRNLATGTVNFARTDCSQ